MTWLGCTERCARSLSKHACICKILPWAVWHNESDFAMQEMTHLLHTAQFMPSIYFSAVLLFLLM